MYESVYHYNACFIHLKSFFSRVEDPRNWYYDLLFEEFLQVNVMKKSVKSYEIILNNN